MYLRYIHFFILNISLFNFGDGNKCIFLPAEVSKREGIIFVRIESCDTIDTNFSPIFANNIGPPFPCALPFWIGFKRTQCCHISS